jgi:uncharacterized OB-fold protein
MVICSDCGHYNQDKDTFCGSCGNFLEWTGEKHKEETATAVQTPVQPEPEAPAPRNGFIQRVQAAADLIAGNDPPVGAPRAAATSPPGSASSAGDRIGDAADAPARTPEAAPPAEATASRHATDSATITPQAPPPAEAALAAPVVEQDVPGAHGEPEELLPQATTTRVAPVTRTALPGEKRNPGDLICGECGSVNTPTRKFCHRCGNSLLTAEVVQTPWWRKIFHKRGPKVIPSGARQSAARQHARHSGRAGKVAHGIARKASAGVGVLIVIAALLFGLVPSFRGLITGGVNSAKGKVTDAAKTSIGPVRPADVTGSDAVKGHSPKAAFDEFTNTYWAAPWSKGDHPSLKVQLASPASLYEVLVTAGDSKDFTAHDRPSVLKFSYPNGKFDVVHLKDTPKAQKVKLTHAVGVSEATLSVIDVHPAQGAKNVALSEVELFGTQ